MNDYKASEDKLMRLKAAMVSECGVCGECGVCVVSECGVCGECGVCVVCVVYVW